MTDLIGIITEMADSIASQLGVFVVDVEIAGNARRRTVRVFIDKEKGVTLEDCEKFSRSMAAVMDVEDPIKSAYVLEVSSPGLDRPLKKLRDFQMSVGRKAKVVLREKTDGESFFTGRIEGVRGEVIHIKTDDGREMDVSFDQISKARLEIELK